MSKEQKILTTGLWALAVLMMIGLIASWSGLRAKGARNVDTAGDGPAVVHVEPPAPIVFEVPDFALTDQEGRVVTLADLKGHPWVAAFIFTRCSGICPTMAVKMKRLQERIEDKSVKLVFFSVDPAHDTPEVLKAYAARLGADAERWRLLTGDREVIEKVAFGLKIPAMQAEKPEEITHSDRFVLVGPDGRTRGYYQSSDEEAMARLTVEAKQLAAEHATAASAGRSAAGAKP